MKSIAMRGAQAALLVACLSVLAACPGNQTATGRSPHVLLCGGLDRSTVNTTNEAATYDPLTGSFQTTANRMSDSRRWHTATLLTTGPDSGKILILGGQRLQANAASVTIRGRYEVIANDPSDFSITPLASAELYDPRTRTFSTTSSLPAPRWGHTATVLQNGSVLIAGGGDPAAGGTPVAGLASALLYVPGGGFTALPDMQVGRVWQTATLLADGSVLVAGGSDDPRAEIFVPSGNTGSFHFAAGAMTAPRSLHSATLLASGKVLLAGGLSGGHTLATAEVFDPSTGAFTPTAGSLHIAREGHTATRLMPVALVLLAGGDTGGTSGFTRTAEVYDPVSDAFEDVPHPMGEARGYGSATLFDSGPSSGRVLIACGTLLGANAELYDPASQTFTATGPPPFASDEPASAAFPAP